MGLDQFPPHYIEMFSNVDCSDSKLYLERKVNWKSIENLPKCQLGLSYPKFEDIVWQKVHFDYDELLLINAKELLDRFDGQGYLLSAFKYHRIRRELSRNSEELPFFYSEVYLDEDGQYRLLNGRHRLNALMNIYGLEYITVKKMRDDIFKKD